jgi:hypothetical protein
MPQHEQGEARDGSVAVEDVATWLEGRASFYPAKGFAVDGAIAMAFRSAARDFRAEFSRPSTDDVPGEDHER